MSRPAASGARRCSPRVPYRHAEDVEEPTRPRSARARWRRWGARCHRPTCEALLYAQLRASAMGRGRGAMPDLRQLHDGLPDMFLHHRSRTSPTSAAGTRSVAALGSCFGRFLNPRRRIRPSTRSRYRQWMTHKLGDLDRPVRHLRLRRLRALHHLVPGRDRHHRGGPGDPRNRAADAPS